MSATSVDEAVAALRSAPAGDAVLLSPERAGIWLGPGWWRALVDETRAVSSRPFADLLDCGDAPGRTLEALRLGLRGLILAPDAPGRETIAARCALLGATLLDKAPPLSPAVAP